MPVVSAKGMLVDAAVHAYAVGAFNVENMEMMQAVVRAAEEERVPVILQTTPTTVEYASTALFSAMARALADSSELPIALHLDHSGKFSLCERAVADGYTSVMIDGSKLPIEENIALAGRVVAMVSAFGSRPTVEAELGRLGGKEDAVETAEGADIYTDPEQAARFVSETGIDSLAVAIGTAHGFYKGEPKLDFVRLGKIRDAVTVPLVLHGSSGISDADVARTVSLGICKVNFATELRAAYTEAVRELLSRDVSIYDPKKFGEVGRDAVTRLVKHRLRVCAG